MVRVDSSGILTAVEPGTVDVFCWTEEHEDEKSVISVTVISPVGNNKESRITLRLGGPDKLAVRKLVPALSPEDTSERSFSFTSGDEKIVKVDEDGTVRAVGPGNATIVIQDKTDKKVKGVCRVTVIPAVRSISGIDIGPLDKGGKANLQPSYEPAGAEPHFQYASSNEKVATINSSGHIEAKSCGVTVLTVSAGDGSGISATSELRVVQKANSINSQNKNNQFYLFVGQSMRWNIEFTPSDVTNTKLSYEYDPMIVSVSEDGVITAGVPENTRIKASTADGSGKSTYCDVHIEPRIPVYLTSAAINPDEPDRILMCIKNACSVRKVTNIEFVVEWYDQNGNYHYEESCLEKDIVLEPQSTAEAYAVVKNFQNVQWHKFLITRVRFSDGSVYDIPPEYRQ